MGENIRYMFEVVTDEAVRELNALSKGFDSLSTGFKKLSSLGNSFSKTMHTGASSIKKLTTAASALSGVALGKVFADATKEAIDYYETLNLFQVAMKGSIEQGNEFINTISEWYGLDPKNLMQYTGIFYEMAYAVGAPDKAAQQLSTSLTALSVDLASLFNMDVERTANNLTSGMRGMSKAVVKYGLDLRAATVEAYANSLGITQQYESMNEASREILRYLVAVKQARDATGDFGRTIEQPANQLRVFKEQMSQVGRAVGTFIIQPLQAALPVINGFVMAIRVMLETLAAVMGFKLEVDNTNLSDTSDAVASIGSSADGTKKKIKSLLAPFDELNILQENTSSGSGGATLEYGAVDPVILQALEEAQYTLEEVRMKAMDTRDAVLAFFGFTPDGDSWIYSPELFEKNLKEKFPNWQQTIESLFNFNYEGFLSNVSLLFGSFKRIAQEAIGIVIQDLSNLLGIDLSDSTIAGWIDGLNQKFFELRSWIIENQDGIAQFLAKVIEFGGAFLIVSSVLGALSGVFSIFSGIATIISGVFSSISGAISGIVALSGAIQDALGYARLFLFMLGQSIPASFGVLAAGIVILVAGIIDGFKDIWSNSEQFRNNFGILVDNIGNLLMSLIELVKNVVKLVIDIVEPIIQTIGDILQPIYPLVVNIINSIVGAVQGLVDVLNGILTGDLTLVFKGFMKIIMGIVEAVMNVGAGIVNAIISIIVGAINSIGRLVYGFVKGAVDAANSVGSLLGLNKLNYPSESLFVVDNIPQIVPPAFDYGFANGGVVTGPTRALIGEAGRAEMVMPLDNSPQMQQFISQIADAVRGNNAQPTEVHVYLDSRAVASTVYDELHNVGFRRGTSLIK